MTDDGFVPAGTKKSGRTKSGGPPRPPKAKGNDLLADSEAVGPAASRWDEDLERDITCGCCGANSAKLMCLLAYLIGIFSFIIALTEKRSYYVVFHACQSMVISSIYCVIAIVFALIDHLVIKTLAFSVLSFVWFCLFAILLIFCIVYAWRNAESGDLFQIVGLGRLAEKMADKFFSIGNGSDRANNNEEL